MIKINLDDVLKEKNITSKELSKKIGITEANISILRSGKAKAIRLSTLSNICKNLNCQPGDILKYEENSMKKFTLEKRDGRYFILDEDKKELLKVNSENEKVEILDPNGRIIAKIRRKKIQMMPSDMPVFEGEFRDGQKFEIRKDMKNFKSCYEVSGMNLKTEGSIFSEEFTVNMKETFANVKRQGEDFDVEVEDEECIHKFSAFLLALSMLMEYEKMF